MIKEKEIQLKEKLKIFIKNYGHDNTIKKFITDEFKSRNIKSSDVLRGTWVFTSNLDLNTLSDEEDDIRFLFLFSYSLNKALKSEGILPLDLENYFTKVEIDKWEEYKEEGKSKTIFPKVIKNAVELRDNIWQCVFTAQELASWEEDNLLLYNFKTQRNPKITAAGEKINLDINKVYQIKERLLKGDQYPDPIILNCIGEVRPTFNGKNGIGDLIFNEGTVINVVDGYHREVANALAVEENLELNFKWQITFTFLSLSQAHDYMAQKDKQKPIKKEYIAQMDYSLVENLAVDAIIDDKLSELAKVMKDDDAYIKNNRALTKKSIIAKAIIENYEEQLETSINIRAISNWIVEFTDYLMGSYIKEFITNPYEIKKNSMINHKNMFYGYIALSSELYNNSDWKILMKEKIESIDFNNEAQLWKDLGMVNNTDDANKTLRYKLYNFFKGGAA